MKKRKMEGDATIQTDNGGVVGENNAAMAQEASVMSSPNGCPSSSTAVLFLDGKDRPLRNLCIRLSPELTAHLSHDYNPSCDHLSRVLEVMTRPPAVTVCRINQIHAKNRSDVMHKLKRVLVDMTTEHKRPPHGEFLWDVKEDDVFPDVILIVPRRIHSEVDDNSGKATATLNDIQSQSVWSTPTSTKIVLVDRFCGEAVLRGSDIFVKGVLAASAGIWQNDTVAVYADLPANGEPSTSRGLVLRHNQEHSGPSYHGTCVYLGLGTVQLPRKEIFTLSQGVAVKMSLDPADRAFQLALPPLHNILPMEMMLQNFPSIVVAHTLDPQPNDVVLDMCAAPGGKTSHLASLVGNQATIVACDKSRKKVLAARDTFQTFGATCITPLALDTTKCTLEKPSGSIERKSVQQILDEAPVHPEDGLKDVTNFDPASFDRILLDPPCSALGLRPKLLVRHQSVKSMTRHATYQKRFVRAAVRLLKPGGYLTYSTCTIAADENERMVAHVLQEYGNEMELLSVPFDVGGPGLPNCGLTDEQRHKVRRFDSTEHPNDDCIVDVSHTAHMDTMGFFLALFRKKGK